MRESKTERDAVKYCVEEGGVTVKLQIKGWPDRIFVTVSGVHIWCEFKSTVGKLAALQEYVAEQLELRGIKVHTIKSMRQFKELYDKPD
jgi:hypothetical protein